MIINTNKRAIKRRISGFILTLFFIGIIAAIFTTNIVKRGVAGLEQGEIAIIVTIIYILILLYSFLIDYNYIYYNDNEDKVIIKYYSLRPLSKKHNVIEIPKNKLEKFQFKHAILNLKHYLVLYQKMNKGIAKYPPLNVTLLDTEQKNLLRKALTEIVNKN